MAAYDWCSRYQVVRDFVDLAVPWEVLRTLTYATTNDEELRKQNFLASLTSIACALLLLAFALVLGVPCLVLLATGCIVSLVWASVAIMLPWASKPALSPLCWDLLNTAHEEAIAAVEIATAATVPSFARCLFPGG